MKIVSAMSAAALVVAGQAAAGFVGFESDTSVVEGKFVCRVYAKFDSANDVVVSVFGLEGFANSSWNHSDLAGGSWNPQFTQNANVDSYVTIGGTPGFSNTTVADLAWGAAGFNQPGIPNGAGWFNSIPQNGQGQVNSTTLRTLIGQWVHPSTPTELYFSPLTVSFNQGVGTPIQFANGMMSVCFPSPGVSAVFVLAAATGRRRR
jgi:hypothetical protein